jgi:hypothetical protein
MLLIVAQNRYENACVSEIGRQFDSSYCSQADTRILNLALDNLAELDAKLFFDSTDSSTFHL